MMPSTLSMLTLLCCLTGSARAGSTIGDLPTSVLPAPEPGDGGDAPRADLPRRELHELRVEGDGIGSDRSAFVWVPEGEGPFPVIFAIHGGKKRDGRDMVPKLQKAQRRDVILVYPNGGEVQKGRGWVGPDKHDGTTPDRDVRYFRALIHALRQQGYPIDPQRMYVTGMSGGGYMTDLLWCEMSDTFAGFAVVARAMPRVMSETCDVARPRPYLLMLGTADPGLEPHQLSLEDTRAFVRTQLGCPDERVVSRTLPDKGDALVVRHKRYTCKDGVAFDDYEIEGGGHAWPGVGKPDPKKTEDVDATEVILQAFGL